MRRFFLLLAGMMLGSCALYSQSEFVPHNRFTAESKSSAYPQCGREAELAGRLAVERYEGSIEYLKDKYVHKVDIIAAGAIRNHARREHMEKCMDAKGYVWTKAK